MNARQRRRRELDRERIRLAADPLLHDLLHALAQERVVAVARHVDQARDVASERIAVHEQGDVRPLLQAQHAHRRRQQVVLRHAEQLVARQRLEDVQQRLAVMAGGRQARPDDDVAHLAAQQRDVARRAVVGDRGEQPDEQPLADHLAVLVEPLHPDRVELHRAVHGRAPVRLVHHQELRLAQEVGDLGRHLDRLAGAFEQHRRLRPQYAAGRAGHGMDDRATVRPLDIALAIAEEGEMVGIDPAQELARLVDLGGGKRRRRGVELGDHLGRADAHLGPVLDRGAHVGQHALDLLAHVAPAPGRVDRADLDMHGGFARRVLGRLVAGIDLGDAALAVAPDGDHRVDHQVRRQLHRLQRLADRIHQERHVVVDDLDHRRGR